MLTETQKRNLERAVKAVANPLSGSNPIYTEDDSPWEESSNVVQLKSGFGDAGFKVGTASVPYTAEGDDSTGDFDSGETGTNIAHDGTAWGNNVDLSQEINYSNKQTNDSSPYTTAASSNWSGFDAYKAFDGTTDEYMSGSNVPQWVSIDFGTATTLVAYQIQGKAGGDRPARSPKNFTFEGWNGGSWDVLDTQTNQTFLGTLSPLYELASPASYNKYRINVSAVQGAPTPLLVMEELYLFDDTYYATDNTITTNELISAGTISFDPSSLVVKDTSNNTIAGDTFNIAYDRNGAGMTSLVAQSTFKALAASVLDGCTSLKLKLQPVGDETIKSVQLSTVSSGSVNLKTGAVTITVGGSIVYKTETDGDVTATDITCDDINATGNIAADGAVSSGALVEDGAGTTLTVVSTDAVVRCNTDAGAITVNLPDLTAASAIDGQRVRISDEESNAGANTITVVPYNTLSALDVDTIAFQAGNTIRYTFNGSPDLSNVKVGNYLVASSSTNASNDGTFVITAVDDGSDYIEVTNAGRSDGTDDEATDSPSVCNVEQTCPQDAGAATTNRHELDANDESVVLVANTAKMRWEVE